MSSHQWLEPAADDDGQPIPSLDSYRGVVLRADDGSPIAYPPTLSAAVIRTVLRIDVPVVLTMSSEVTSELMRQLKPRQTEIVDRDTGITLPIIDSIHNLASGQVTVSRGGFVCLCRKERLVLIWNETVSSRYLCPRTLENLLTPSLLRSIAYWHRGKILRPGWLD